MDRRHLKREVFISFVTIYEESNILSRRRDFDVRILAQGHWVVTIKLSLT